MKCQEVKQKIFTYLDGCLNTQLESEFMSHLSHCDSCRRELEDARQFNRLLEESCTIVEPPVDFVSRVMDRIDEVEKNNVAAKVNNVVALPEHHADKKKNILERLAAGGFRFSKVASFAALVAAISAFIAFSHIPEMTKMANLGHKFNDAPTVETSETPDSVLTPGRNDDNKGPGGNIGAQETEPATDDPEQQKPGEGEQEPSEQEPATNPEDPAETSDSPETPPQTLAEPSGGEGEVVPELPRLDGPIRQVTGVTSVVAKSVSLTPISTDSNYASLKPSWAERGKKIYYFSTQEADDGNYTLWAKGLNDSSAEVMAKNATKNVNTDKPQSKSPDGKYKLYQDQGQIYVAKADGSDAKPITPKLDGASLNYAWRPDGKSVAISVKGTPSQGLWLADAQGGSWSLITANGGGTSLSWSADGKKIAFTDTNNMIYVGVLVAENRTNLLMVVPEGDNQGNVTLAWSPDSQKLLFDWAKDGSTRGVYLATIPN